MGLFDFLDQLGAQAGSVAGRAVDAAGNVAIARVNADSAARVADESSARPAATLSAGLNLGGNTLLWIIGGAILIGGIVLLARR